MALFEMNGKEYELKLDFKSVKHLNGLYEGGALELIGKAMQGDLETFVRIVHAGLIHTGEKFTYKDVEKAIEEAFEAGKLDMEYVLKTSNEVVTNSFFYKKMTDKILAKDPKAANALKELLM
jgi:Phage tail assembly chaperone protein, TAC